MNSSLIFGIFPQCVSNFLSSMLSQESNPKTHIINLHLNECSHFLTDLVLCCGPLNSLDKDYILECERFPLTLLVQKYQAAYFLPNKPYNPSMFPHGTSLTISTSHFNTFSHTVALTLSPEKSYQPETTLHT